MALIAALVLVSALPAPVHAEVPTTGGSVIPVTQKWIGDTAPDSSVTYAISPVGDITDSGYRTNTKEAVKNGIISYFFEIADESDHTLTDRFILLGESSAKIRFSWTKAGLYLFDLNAINKEAVFDDGHGYYYDHTTYRIRLYVENDNKAFFTVQNLSKTDNEDTGKVGDIIYTHRYVKSNNNTDGNNSSSDGDSSDSDGRRNQTSDAAKNNCAKKTQNSGAGTTTEEINRIDEKGKPDDSTYQTSGDGTHRNWSTGDASNMLLYAVIAIGAAGVLIVWTIWRRRSKTK